MNPQRTLTLSGNFLRFLTQHKLAPEWVLAIVGIVTLIAIWYQAVQTKNAAEAARDSVKAMRDQAGIMERQTKAAEVAAEAARRTAEAVVKIERAWVDVYFRKVGPAVYDLEVTNCGRTIAKIKEYSLAPKLSAPVEVGPELGKVNFETSRTAYCSKLLEPRDKPWVAETLNLVESLGGQDFKDVWSNKKRLAFYGTMKYDDVAGDPHETEFGYYFDAAPNRQELVRIQTPEYNKHT